MEKHPVLLKNDNALSLISAFVEYLSSLSVNKNGVVWEYVKYIYKKEKREGCTILIRDKETGRTFSHQFGEDSLSRCVDTWEQANRELEAIWCIKGSRHRDARSVLKFNPGEKVLGGAVANDDFVVSSFGFFGHQNEVLSLLVLSLLSISSEMLEKSEKGLTNADHLQLAWPHIQTFYDENVSSQECAEHPGEQFMLLCNFALKIGARINGFS